MGHVRSLILAVLFATTCATRISAQDSLVVGAALAALRAMPFDEYCVPRGSCDHVFVDTGVRHLTQLTVFGSHTATAARAPEQLLPLRHGHLAKMTPLSPDSLPRDSTCV